MGKEMDSVGACLTCWLKDGGQRVGMALPRVILKRQKSIKRQPHHVISLSTILYTYQSNEALQKSLRVIGHAGHAEKTMFEIANQSYKMVETLLVEVNARANRAVDYLL